ncbi:inositol monophosphatase family protein [Corynebacterium sp. CCUG 65737]|uniref:inositol monophosphatase family protein n=1 Tax=Corynebacterium sp. CCUG 65737 TaxID=2823889 RepID=UPI00210E996E|nr:inositol monophosphatase family protein [Corynebacterium sp. CCUG 65737]MCQ4627981.1 inositol monophosphatase family protein [Corynebacterium sp. CCUG 65737]
MAAVSTAAFIESHTDAPDHELAAALTRTAGELALHMRNEGLETSQKTSVSDVVTQADMAAERFVADALMALRPDDGILGEEGAAKKSTSGRTWVIDPVDGTYNFSCGSDYFCSALALVEGAPSDPERIFTSAVTRPALNTTWVAHDGTSERNGEQLPHLENAPLTQLALATYLHPRDMDNADIRGAWMRAASQAATVRMWGAGSVDLATVASGGIGGWIQHSVADWDWLPGKALVEGAGGKAIKVDAGGVTWCVAGNSQVVDEVAALLLQ